MFKKLYINSTVPIIILPLYPSHAQNVELHIRLVSQTSKIIVSPELRDARINITQNITQNINTM